MQRMLCLRFPNWPVQRLLRCLRESSSTAPRDDSEDAPSAVPAIAIHSAVERVTADNSLKSELSQDGYIDVRELRERCPAARHNPVIVAVSSTAWRLGLRPGMPLAEARGVVAPPAGTGGDSGRRRPSSSRQPAAGSRSAESVRGRHTSEALQFFEWQPVKDREALAAAAEIARRYSPVVCLDDMPIPDALLLDITGCSHLFGSESSLAESLLRDMQRAGYYGRLAIAENVAAAWAITHVEASDDRVRRHKPRELSSLRIQIIPSGQHLAELRPLPVSAARIPLRDLDTLSCLGIRTIGQLLSLPTEDLPSRLSVTTVTRIQQILNITPERLTSLPEADPVQAVWHSDEPGNGLHDVRCVLEHLTEQIAAILVRRQLGCVAVECLFSGLSGSTVRLEGSVVKPTQSATLLTDVLVLRVETAVARCAIAASKKAALSSPGAESGTQPQERVEIPEGNVAVLESQPFNHVIMKATVTPLPRARQRDLFSTSDHLVPTEELATLVTRLNGRLGESSVLTAYRRADARPEFATAVRELMGQVAGASALEQHVVIERLVDAENLSDAGDDSSSPRPLRLLAVPRLIPRPVQAAQPVQAENVTKSEQETSSGCETQEVTSQISTGSVTAKASVSGSAASGQFPRQLTLDGTTYVFSGFSAVERIQTGWWTEHPCHRDYYRARTRNGSLLWIFRNLQDGQWYLHGFFD